MKQSVQEFKSNYISRLKAVTAKSPDETTTWDRYYTLGVMIRDMLTEDWVNQNRNLTQTGEKQVYYFSMEFLTGRNLLKNLDYVNKKDLVEEAFKELGYDLREIAEIEKDPGLGNGGLGRLAACFLDSLASTGYAGHGCGIRYNYGLFEQKIVNGYQVEFPDRWLSNRNVWEIRKQDRSIVVEFGGHVTAFEENGRLNYKQISTEKILAVPYDTPVAGYRNDRINNLRLFSAEALQGDFDFYSFSEGDYQKAFAQKHTAEAISQVLYPNDNYYEGRVLRLKQEFFLVSAGVQSLLRTYKKSGRAIEKLSDHIAIHINDTHPSLIIPELMRLLLDDFHLSWEDAWAITTKTCSYTNHTILAEALEKWPLALLHELLPRVAMIIEEIDRRYVDELIHMYRLDAATIDRMRIIHHGTVFMAHLCIVSSNSVNGVAKLHTEILKHRELADFYRIYPYKFNNKTNGITHRRWLMNCNVPLTNYITEALGTRWHYEPVLMDRLMQFYDDSAFLEGLDAIKLANKKRLAAYIKESSGIVVDPYSIFDMHAKRLHEYKRQLMNIFHIMHLYNQLVDHPGLDVTPRTFVFGAKAAPGYYIAKQIIRLIHSLATKIEKTPHAKDIIKIVFLENYGVSLAERMIPAADVSEQISTASKEASGTGNMKFMMNGAITIGTLDGANVEISEAVGPENIYIFGLTADEVYQTYHDRSYNAMAVYDYNEAVHRIMDQLVNGFFDDVPKEEFMSIRDSILKQNDEFLVLKDFDAYVRAQKQVGADYKNAQKWQRMSLVNIAKSGIFSSDYTIKEYAQQIWKL
jgi:starch phosphorylase